MSSDLEEQILAIERELYTLPDLSALLRRLVALEQGVAQSWTGVSFQGPPPAPPTCTDDFSAVCPCIPATLKLTDSLTGICNIAYDHANLWWLGCKIFARPGNATCTARNIPVWFQMFGDNTSTNWFMTVRWFAPNNPSVCPTTGKTCSDNIFGSGALNKSTDCPMTCTDGVFGASGEVFWANQNQVGLPGTISSFTIGPP